MFLGFSGSPASALASRNIPFARKHPSFPKIAKRSEGRQARAHILRSGVKRLKVVKKLKIHGHHLVLPQRLTSASLVLHIICAD